MGNQQQAHHQHQNANWTVQNVLGQTQQQQNNFAKQIVNQNKRRCSERFPNPIQRDEIKKKSGKIKHVPQIKENLGNENNIKNVLDPLNSTNENLPNVRSQNQLNSIANLSTSNQLQDHAIDHRGDLMIQQIDFNQNQNDNVNHIEAPIKKIRASRARLL